MCQELYIYDINNEKSRIDGLGELREFLSGQNIYWNGENGDHLPDNICLCWVDLRKTGREIGYAIEDDPFGVIWRVRE